MVKTVDKMVARPTETMLKHHRHFTGCLTAGDPGVVMVQETENFQLDATLK